MSLQIALLAALTLAVGWLMMYAGVSKSALEWRRSRRTCPSCGRQIVARTCPCSAG
jgi:formate dehydrogenase maturation protein FdhE